MRPTTYTHPPQRDKIRRPDARAALVRSALYLGNLCRADKPAQHSGARPAERDRVRDRGARGAKGARKETGAALLRDGTHKCRREGPSLPPRGEDL